MCTFSRKPTCFSATCTSSPISKSFSFLSTPFNYILWSLEPMLQKQNVCLFNRKRTLVSNPFNIVIRQIKRFCTKFIFMRNICFLLFCIIWRKYSIFILNKQATTYSFVPAQNYLGVNFYILHKSAFHKKLTWYFIVI